MEPAPGGDEFKLPGCGQSALAIFLFGVPWLALFLVVAVAEAYSADWDWFLVTCIALLFAGIVLAGRGVVREQAVAHGVVFATATVLVMTAAGLAA